MSKNVRRDRKVCLGIYKVSRNSLQILAFPSTIASSYLLPTQQSINTSQVLHQRNKSTIFNMLASSITFFGLVAAVFAAPFDLESRQVTLTGCTSTPQCCDVDVLGVADLNCEVPPAIPTSIQNFSDICASVGKQNVCCILPILDQALLCTSPDGN
ncbi:hypothetical protein HYFRA_00008867 [Hymenoscyphus fraxineus]|uniref:Hydrophobin n=1 Tax=Hymenoscyphus fraxineus TaxID=746836 RepID=A0A9N9KZR3_9HELO|nr:hypothetical protein HYFRA_00008867 [Hymenoscyphus fraxineus]